MDAEERYRIMVAMAARDAGLPLETAHRLFDCFWITLATSLAAGNNVSFPGVGLMHVRGDKVGFDATTLLKRILGALPDERPTSH